MRAASAFPSSTVADMRERYITTTDGFRRARPAGGCAAASGGTCAPARAAAARARAVAAPGARMPFAAARPLRDRRPRGRAAARVSARGVSAAPTERITSFVAGRAQLFALRGNTVVTFDAGGREIGAAPRSRRRRRRPRGRRPSGRSTPTRRFAWPGLPDDESGPPRPKTPWPTKGSAPATARARVRRPRDRAHALAASAWRTTSGSRRRPASTGDATARARGWRCAGRDVIAVAAGGGAVAAATADLFWRRRRRRHVRGGRRAGRSRPRALAIVDDSARLVATDDGVLEIGPYGVRRRVLDQAADRARRLRRDWRSPSRATAPDRWTPGRAAGRAGDRPPARALACGGDARRALRRGGPRRLHLERRRDLVERIEAAGTGRGAARRRPAAGSGWPTTTAGGARRPSRRVRLHAAPPDRPLARAADSAG